MENQTIETGSPLRSHQSRDQTSPALGFPLGTSGNYDTALPAASSFGPEMGQGEEEKELEGGFADTGYEYAAKKS